MKRSTLVILIILLVLIFDQCLKVWVKTNMSIGQDIPILGLDWAYIHFVENPGMAFGIQLGGQVGKLLLSIFRILAVCFLFYFIKKLIDAKAGYGLLACFALITAGAIGNILDSAFYGLFFSASKFHGGIAEFMPADGGYASFLMGNVVDMLYFPMYKGVLPEWVPFRGGTYFEFFKPVFNIADASITTGVLSIILFQRSFFQNEDKQEAQADLPEDNVSTSEGPAEADQQG